MEKLPQLPYKVFIQWEEGSDKPYLSPATNVDELSYDGAKIGVYELKHIRTFKLIETTK